VNSIKYNWTARIKATGKSESICYVRQHDFIVGHSVSFDNKDESISSMEYVLGAIGGDIISSLNRMAKKKRVTIDMIETVVTGELTNPLVYLQVIGEEGFAGIDNVQMKVFISSLDDIEVIEQIWKDALKISPLINTFKESVQFNLVHKIVF